MTTDPIPLSALNIVRLVASESSACVALPLSGLLVIISKRV